MKEFLLDFLFLLTHPNYLVMLGKYDKRLDKFILNAIEKELFTVSRHTELMRKYRGSFYEPFEIDVKDGDDAVEVWIRNYPYGYGAIGNKRPSRRTVRKLRIYLDGRPDLT